MIHDKDYMMRMIRQFSEFLSKLILDNNEGRPDEIELVLDTQLRNIFKTDFETFKRLSKKEIIEIVSDKEDHHQADYYQMLGHLFFFKNKQIPNKDFAEKSKIFYELWIQKSGIFSLPVMARISELKNDLES